jgi:hemerythrin
MPSSQKSKNCLQVRNMPLSLIHKNRKKRIREGIKNSLVWNDEDYSVNIPAIDNEHKLLVALLNEIACAMNTQGSSQINVIIGKLAYLSGYVKIHFESEERFLIVNNYPDYDDHKAEHARMLEQITTFEARYKSENKAFNEEMLLFLKDWLVRHMILYDRKFGYYFRDKEIIQIIN